MCGICGFTGAQEPELLRKMADLIVHRGPDEEGFYLDGRINLGSRRLSIIDLSTGQQPVHNETGTIWAVWNGEIYNFLELREWLKAKGHVFYTHHSDSEVIVHLYEECGADFVHKINGMFAIAVWDAAQERLLLVRDRMGVKPLFYSVVKGQMVFASEIKCLLAYPGYSKEPDYSALYHYFSFKNVPAPWTAFKGIFSLLPGEMLTFEAGRKSAGGRVEKWRYWQIDFSQRCTDKEETTREKIRDLLSDAVRLRMVSDVPVGAYLSGGVDSSTVVALMKSSANVPVKTFCLGYENPFKNKEEDLLFARKVAAEFGTEHHEYVMSAREVADEMDNIVRSFDQPFAGVVSTYFLSKLISRHVKVALSGDGADELFGSYLAHRLAQPMHSFAGVYRQYKRGRLTVRQKKMLAPFEDNIGLLEDLHEFSGGSAAKWRYKLMLFGDGEKEVLLSKDFLAHMRPDGVPGGTYELVREHFARSGSGTTDPLNRMLEFDWHTLLPDQVLAFVDFLSMAHSVEVRSPFLDYRLVEYVASVPGGRKIRNGIVKDLLKKTVQDIIPPGITGRPKEGFVLPVFEWMKHELKEYVSDILAEDNIKQSGLLDSARVVQLLTEYYRDGGQRYELAGRLWAVAMFQAWWDSYFCR